MLDKERLEELINRKPNRWGNLTIYEFERDIKILQEQAERVQELEEEVERYQSGRYVAVITKMKMDVTQERNERLEKRVQELEKQNEQLQKQVQALKEKAEQLIFEMIKELQKQY